MTEKALAVIEGEFRDIAPVVSPEDAKKAMEAYQALAQSVTDASDYQTFRDKKTGTMHKFRKRSGWKKLERFYGVSVEVREERIFHDHRPATCLRVRMPEHFKDVVDCGCPVKGVRYVMRAVDVRTGRYSENIGICVAGEKRVSADASLHDLATRALNRGANRATADLIGVSDPSAEEQAAEAGFAKEDRQELLAAWKAAHPETQQQALAWLRANEAYRDSADEMVYRNFLARGTDDDLAHLMGMLTASEGDFDPDDVPAAAAAGAR